MGSLFHRCTQESRLIIITTRISMQNPFLYGVSKAGVEQGLRWLSCQNENHSLTQ